MTADIVQIILLKLKSVCSHVIRLFLMRLNA